MKKRVISSLGTGITVTFPEPWAAIRRPGVRLCLDEPVEVITAISRYCVPVYTLSKDVQITSFVKQIAHYFHVIPCHAGPDVCVSYVSLPRFILALRSDDLFRTLVLSASVRIVEG